jgi:hypothetical protein
MNDVILYLLSGCFLPFFVSLNFRPYQIAGYLIGTKAQIFQKMTEKQYMKKFKTVS